MRRFAALGLIAYSMLACSSTPDYPEAPPVIQGQIDMILDRLRREQGTEMVNDLRRLVAYDVYAVPRLIELLDDREARLRSGAAFALGDINDARVVPALQDHVEDPVEMVRLEVARSLLHRGDWGGVPILIQGLRSPDAGIRMRCDEALRNETLKDFRFPVEGSVEDRERAIAKWEQWWQIAQADVQG